LNFGGLPGLAQLGSLVGIGVALSACVMIFAFLPPLFPDRMKPRATPAAGSNDHGPVEPLNPARTRLVFGIAMALILGCAAVLFSGLPKLDGSNDALQPRNSQAYAALGAIKDHLNQRREPLWLIVAGRDEREVARRLEAVQPALSQAVSNHVLTGFMIPTVLWPHPDNQSANRTTAQQLISRREAFHAAARTAGFSPEALALTDGLLDTWQRAVASTNVFWPDNPLCTWIFAKLAARETTNQFAVGFLFPPTNSVKVAAFDKLNAQLPPEGVWLAGWEILGGAVLEVVKKNLWKLVLPMMGLVLLSLWFAFRRPTEIALSLGILLLSGLCLLAVMRLMGWSWNLLNLMAVPLILGTGVDYSLFMQLALRRHHGDLGVAHRSVGRALLLCGATACSGFGSLAFSSNVGMASLGQGCAVGIAGNMLISVYLLPVWWRHLVLPSSPTEAP
ncbi:MAG: MMPL family transporter, partial [Pedosphaera parvula]|nr:MMPL family transporter [Pedosphaera parvula]